MATLYQYFHKHKLDELVTLLYIYRFIVCGAALGVSRVFHEGDCTAATRGVILLSFQI